MRDPVYANRYTRLLSSHRPSLSSTFSVNSTAIHATDDLSRQSKLIFHIYWDWRGENTQWWALFKIFQLNELPLEGAPPLIITGQRSSRAAARFPEALASWLPLHLAPSCFLSWPATPWSTGKPKLLWKCVHHSFINFWSRIQKGKQATYWNPGI